MRITFCGSGPFAAPALRAIRQAGHELAAVISQPPRPSGRGGKVHPTPLAQAAREMGLEVREIADVNAADAVEQVRAARADVIVVADFGQFVRAPFRETAPLGAFNLHGSILPDLRGAAPVNWAIIRGYKHTGVTTFSLVDKMDAGDVYLTAETDINPDETAEELKGRLAAIGAELVVKTLDLLAGSNAKPTPQDHSKMTLAPRLKREDGLIDWSKDAQAIHDLIHGTWPWPAGHAIFIRKDGLEMPVLIARCRVEGGDARGEPGTLDGDLCISCGRGRLRLLEIQPAGKKLMPWQAFANGYRPSAGDKFVRPTI